MSAPASPTPEACRRRYDRSPALTARPGAPVTTPHALPTCGRAREETLRTHLPPAKDLLYLGFVSAIPGHGSAKLLGGKVRKLLFVQALQIPAIAPTERRNVMDTDARAGDAGIAAA